MTSEQEERIVIAFETIAGALSDLAGCVEFHDAPDAPESRGTFQTYQEAGIGSPDRPLCADVAVSQSRSYPPLPRYK